MDLTPPPAASRTQPGAPRVVRVRVDELRLEGIDPRLRYRVADAMERELARLFAEADADEEDAPGTGPLVAAERVDAGLVTFAAGASAEQVGIAIARAAYRGMYAASASGGR